MKATIETTKEKIDKVIHIGRGEYGNIFCKIEFNDGKLSITGVDGPTRDGNCRGSCGHKYAEQEANEAFNHAIERKRKIERETAIAECVP